MKAFLAYLWNRWSCRLLLAVAILCALPLLHPFARQTIFGPTIDGLPWCVWEDEVRFFANGGPDERSWLQKALEKIGLSKPPRLFLNLESRQALPLYLHLAEDGNVKVRQSSLGHLSRLLEKDEAAILPAFRRHLEDADPCCRLIAAQCIWRATKDRAMIAVVLPLRDDADFFVRGSVTETLEEMGGTDPDLFDPMSRLVGDANPLVRNAAVRSMRHFGKRGVPILRQALLDADPQVRSSAIGAASELGDDGLELAPVLQELQKNDPRSWFQRDAAHALYKMAPKQFPKPATWID